MVLPSMHGMDRRTWLTGAAGIVALSQLPADTPGASEEILTTPKVNQLGFTPKAPKRFCIVAGPQVPVDGAFTIEDSRQVVVHQGRLGAAVDVTRSAGEHVQPGVFSELVRPGRYRVRVGQSTSAWFRIDEGVYTPLVRDAARTFFLIRANAALDDPVTGLRHALSHQVERALPVEGVPRDLTGGWYNAGDYGKWTHMAAISASLMLWLHELRPDRASALSLDVPITYPALSDLLQQARWGLDWLLKMQNGDGSVLHKVDSEPLFAWGKMPENDDGPRRARGPGSVDSAVLVGALLQAARVFGPIDRDFADRCTAAAGRAWVWLERNPAVLTNDPYYADKDASQEWVWAAAEMAVHSADRSLDERVSGAIASTGLIPFFWPTPQLLGVMSLARSRSAGAGAARDAILQAAEQVAALVETDPYGFSPDPAHYTWGSNELLLNAAVTCFFAAELGNGARHRATALRILDYILGCNALGRSFVTGHGSDSIRRPYHWTMRAAGILMPGWASGGPNGGTAGADPLLAEMIARGTPAAKCHVDACTDTGSWASNEGQISENAALVLVAGLAGWRG